MQRALTLKIIFIGILCFIFFIGFAFFQSIVSERQSYHQQVMRDIARDNVRPQRVISPFIVIPVTHNLCAESTEKAKGECFTEDSLVLTPKRTDWLHHIQVNDKTYKRGIYRAITYEDQLSIKGSFQPDESSLVPDSVYHWEKAKLYLSVSDPRGITQLPILTVAGKKFSFENNLEDNVLSFPNSYISIGALAKSAFQFEIDLPLAGMDSVEVVPLGKHIKMQVDSNWPHPRFFGGNLPNQKQMNAKGIKAIWETGYLASSNIQLLKNCINKQVDACNTMNGVADKSGEYETAHKMEPSDISLGLQFVNPVNIYSLTDRTLKYALLLLMMTFGTFFLFEVLKDLRVHPIQYGLVGIAQAVFYLLLLSFSEQFSFAWAYLGSSIACIFLITWYISYVLHGIKRALGVAVVLASMYATLYILLNSEEHTLMLGSVFVFVLITVVMFLTRNIDWYGLGPQKIKHRAHL